MRRQSGMIFLIAIITLFIAAPQSEASWDFMFSNKKYEPNLTVQTIIVTKDQLCELIKDENDTLSKFTQQTSKELSGKEIYLFVRIRNTGHKAAWGELHSEINKRYDYEINVPWVGSGSNAWHHIIMYVTGIVLFETDKPKIEMHWTNLYAK